MKIAIQAADLDNKRIDGTRVYLLNVLKHLGRISPGNDFFVYHRQDFNPELAPPRFSNYKIKKVDFPFLWTQTIFAREIWKNDSDVLWMPMHNIPIIRKKKLKTVVTIHDLAFKFFPEYFTKKDLRRLNFLADVSVKGSDKIIAVSESTKRDIMQVYPTITKEKISVVYHGFDADLFRKKVSREKSKKILSKWEIKEGGYILYVGAIQPRKNLNILIEAFDLFKEKTNSTAKLVLAGGKAWMWEKAIERLSDSNYKQDIVFTGRVSFQDLAVLYQSAKIFVFPSLYEGFGIPILEAFASEVPVISARNSSLVEVGGDAAEYFDAKNSQELAGKIEGIFNLDQEGRNQIISRGKIQLEKFSWEKCAQETLEVINS